MKHTIQCPTCGGGGRAPLHEHLQETLDAIPRRGFATAEDLHAKFSGITANAISNRLADLFELKLVKRERFGKFWRYSRA